MTKKLVLVFICAGVLFSGCGTKTTQNEKGITLYGQCTQETIDAFHAVSESHETMEEKLTTANALQVVQACADLKGLIGDDSCTAKSTITRKDVSVGFTLVDSLCADAEKAYFASQSKSEQKQGDPL